MQAVCSQQEVTCDLPYMNITGEGKGYSWEVQRRALWLAPSRALGPSLPLQPAGLNSQFGSMLWVTPHSTTITFPIQRYKEMHTAPPATRSESLGAHHILISPQLSKGQGIQGDAGGTPYI